MHQLFFNDDKTTFTVKTKQEIGTEEYKRYYELINIQSIYGGQKYDLPDYRRIKENGIAWNSFWWNWN